MIEEDEDDIKTSCVDTNLSNIVGNITSIVIEDYKKIFGNGFFKTECITSTAPHVRFKDTSKDMTELKPQKPFLYTKPKLNMQNAEDQIDPIHKNFGYTLYDIRRPSFNNIKFFCDADNEIRLDFAVSRLQMQYEFNIVLSTDYQQMNVYSKLLNGLRIECPYFLESFLEVEIPYNIIKQISASSNKPIIDKSGSISNFLKYLNENSLNPITFQLQSATSRYKFFLTIPTNLVMTYERPDMDDGEKNGQVTEDFKITTLLNVQFPYTAVFYISTSKEQKVMNKEPNDILSTVEVPYHFNLYYNEMDKEDENNFKLRESASFDSEKDGEDSIVFKALLEDDEIDAIEHYKTIGILYKDFINIKILENGDYLDYDEYKVDMENYKVTIFNMKKLKTYRFCLYFSNLMFNRYIQQKKKK